MRLGRFAFLAVGAMLSGSAAEAAKTPAEFSSLQSTVDWINAYRVERPAALAPLAIRALSFHGAFKEPEAAGVYVGFIAGLIGTHPENADLLIRKMLPVREEDQWAIVRGIAYSGHPRWKKLLRQFAPQLPNRAVMVGQYLDGTLPVLDELSIKPSTTTFQRVREALTVEWFDSGKKKKKPELEPTQTLLDTLWGYYLASGSYAPVMRMVELLPWSKDKDNVDRLTVGSMAKYTLAMNAARDANLLATLKYVRRQQGKETAAILDEIVQAADTADTGRLRKDALAAIEQLKMKGPAYKREMSTWGKVGQGALAVGCVAAAATGHIELGLPCVIGGGATNAAAYYINDR
ncbi:MAG: hypothetical protein ACR2K5_12035 [Pseudolabrys sp.]